MTDHKEKDVFLISHKIRSGLMFGIAVIASACYVPLIVPLILALLLGTPIAVWLSDHTGWVYGGLPLIFLIGLVLGLRFVRRDKLAKYTPLVLLSKPISKLLEVSRMN